MSLEIIDPTRYPKWDELLLRTPGASFFHSSGWAKVLAESYGYTALYFTVLENGKLRALVPMMEVNSFLTGKRGVSLPFTDYCEPIIEEGIEFQDLLNPIIDHGKKNGWKYIELRGGEKYLRNQESGVRSQDSKLSPQSSVLITASSGSRDLNPESCVLSPGGLPNNDSLNPQCEGSTPYTLHPTPCPFVTYLGHTLDLTKGEKALYSGLRDSTRRNIKKAEKEKVEVRIEKSGEAMSEFCRLNRLTRREHGLPPQPYHFFEQVHRDIISKDSGFIALAYLQGKAIAGNVYFHFGDQGIYKYGASDRPYQELRANNLVMWEAIKWFAGKGFERFCFGRTEMKNQGLQQFKAGWGPEEHQIHYYRYDLRENAFVPGRQKGEPFYIGIFRHVPGPVLNLIGSLLYKHIG